MRFKNLLLALPFLLVITSCQKNSKKNTITGIVFDVHTKKPIADILVKSDDNQAYTGSIGFFSIPKPSPEFIFKNGFSANRLDNGFPGSFPGVEAYYLDYHIQIKNDEVYRGLEIPLYPSGVVSISPIDEAEPGDTMRFITQYDTILSYWHSTQAGYLRLVSKYSDAPFDTIGISYYFHPNTVQKIEWEVISNDSIIASGQRDFFIKNYLKYTNGIYSGSATQYLDLN